MVLAIGVALCADGVFFGEGDAGDFEEEVEHEEWAEESDPAERGVEGGESEGEPDEGFEEVIGVTGVVPEAFLADLEVGGGETFEGLHLEVGESFADEGEEREGEGEDFESGEGGIGVKGGEEKWEGEDDGDEGLELEEEEKFEGAGP